MKNIASASFWQRLFRALSEKSEDERVYYARPLILAFGMCAGSAVYYGLRFEPDAWLVVMLWALSVLALVVALPRVGSLSLLVLIIAFSVMSGVAFAKLRTSMVPDGMLSEELGPVMVEGWVSGIEPGQSGLRLRLLTHAIEGLDSKEMPREIRLTHRASLTVSPGRFVRCRSVLRPPPGPSIPGDYDFRRHAWFSGLHAVGYVQGRCRGGALGAPSDSSIARRLSIGIKRRALAEYTYKAAGQRAGGFAAALTSGDRSYMRDEDREALRRSGLAHLLAISGLHIGIVCGLVYWIVFKCLARIEWLALRVPLQKPAALASLTTGGIYLIISGASVSTQRAYIMAALVFIAILIDRQAISLRTFAVAMIIILIHEPVSVLSPGFQMSFAATGVLVAVYIKWQEARVGMPRGIGSRPAFAMKSLIVTSVAAGIATAPFAFYHFDRVAPFGLIANILAMPIITFITAPAAAISLLLSPFGLADYGLRVFGWSLEMVLAIAHWNEGLDTGSGPQWTPMPATSLVLFSTAIGAFILLTGKLRLKCVVALGLAALLSWFFSTPASAYWAPSGDVYLLRNGTYEHIQFADGEGLAPLSYKGVETTGYCTNRRCLVEVKNGKILLTHQLSDRDCHSLKQEVLALVGNGSSLSCPKALLMQEIEAFGGAAIWLRGSKKVKIKHAYPCGERPWQPRCPA